MTAQTETMTAGSTAQRVEVKAGITTHSFKNAREYASAIVAQLTLEEKVKLLAGSDLWRTNAIPRVGVSKMKFSDGPVGVRGGLFADGVSAASLPTG